MDLHDGRPFWPLRNGLIDAYPPLDADWHGDVVVLGAGITGALIADALTAAGLRVAVVDRRDVATGSTAASTALLQYEIDTELHELVCLLGEPAAVRAYRACEQAVRDLRALSADLAPAARVRKRESCYYADRFWHVPRLRSEFALRQRHGFDVELLTRNDLRQRLGIGAWPLALLSREAGDVDPYRMTHALLRRVRERGATVCDRTRISGWEAGEDGVEVHSDRGPKLRARYLVLAGGFETQTWLRDRVARNRSSYALVTEPLAELPAWLRRGMAWGSARPYHYFRSTLDARVIAGGEDDAIDNEMRRDANVRRKAGKLLKALNRLMPAAQPPAEIAYAWAGTFAETPDGLPYFGAHRQHGPRVLFAMAYGGNGITYSMIGAALLRERIFGRAHADAPLFGFERIGRGVEA